MFIPEDRHDEIIDIAKENPKQLKSAINKIEEVFGERISVKTLKPIIKKTALVPRREISEKFSISFA
ncbi:MAG: hypothetical protein QM498_16045 [Desulfobacterium sp.]